MKNFVARGLNSLTNFAGDFKVGRQISEILHPLSQLSPAYALLRAHLNGEMTFDEMVTHLHAGARPTSLDCYDLVVLYTFCRDVLVANNHLAPTSRKDFIYFSREAGDIFYGHARTTNTLTVFVLNEEHLETVRGVIKDKESKMRNRNKSAFPIPQIRVQLLKDYPQKYRKFKADIFQNIPFIVDTLDVNHHAGK